MTTRMERAKRTLLGRTLCRLLGDRAGGVMVEYVIIGVMVAAAAVFTFVVLGDTISEQVGNLAKILMGKGKEVSEDIADDRATLEAELETAKSTGRTITREQ